MNTTNAGRDIKYCARALRALRIKAAKFPGHKTLEEFNFDHQPAVDRSLIAHLCTGSFLIPPPARLHDSVNLFFHLVSSRYERASLILTGNLAFSSWADGDGGEHGKEPLPNIDDGPSRVCEQLRLLRNAPRRRGQAGGRRCIEDRFHPTPWCSYQAPRGLGPLD